MKKTFQELKDIDVIYSKLSVDKDFANTKLGYAFKRFTEKNTQKIFTDFNEVLDGVRIDNALVDEKTKAILYNEDRRNYQFSKEGLKEVLKRNKEIAKEWEDKEFEVIPFICKDIPESVVLLDEEKELLEGVIINLNETK